MEKQRLVVIGAVAAGTKAASKAMRENPNLDVKIFTKEEHISYAGCGLPYYIGGVIKEKNELVVRTPEIFKREQDIDIFIKHEVTKIDTNAKKVYVTNIDTQEQLEYGYDKLVMATGASPIKPPLENIKLKNIFTLRSVADAFEIRDLVDAGKVQKAVVVGGGFIGLEVAENLRHRDVDVTLIELAPHVLPPFDEEIALLAQAHMQEKGVNIVTGEKVLGFEGKDEFVSKVKSTAGDFEADIVVLSIGVRPNVKLAVDADIELGTTGAIKVDEYMQTSVKDVFAVGDCAENINLVTNQPAWYPMGSTSNKTGRIAGYNVVNSDKMDSLQGVLGTTIVKLFDMNAAKTGLSERDARRAGMNIETILVPATDKAHYYPGNKAIITKLIVEKASHKILGAEIIGSGVVDKPIDIIATAMTLNAKLEDLTKLDLAYAPPFSMAMSSTIMAANVMLNKLNNKIDTITATDLQDKLKYNQVNIVDVREEEECFISSIPGSLNIPMNALERRSSELHKDKETVILVCKVGKRAFLAYLKLKQQGFENIKVLEGGINAYPYRVE
ncbi:MAG: dehydrogenase [Clostridiales bacterium GWB2_37_7]|nr:MAG: dehydrogenase [Clostridiales bacterium GWB2_37_7]